MPCWFIKICLRPSASLTTIGPRARHPRDTRPSPPAASSSTQAAFDSTRRTTPSPTGIYNALSKVRPAGTACDRHRAPPRHTKCAYGRTTLTNHADHKSRRHAGVTRLTTYYCNLEWISSNRVTGGSLAFCGFSDGFFGFSRPPTPLLDFFLGWRSEERLASPSL